MRRRTFLKAAPAAGGSIASSVIRNVILRASRWTFRLLCLVQDDVDLGHLESGQFHLNVEID